MIWVWTILGGLLIAAVLAACLAFFVVRPMMARKVATAADGLSKELHGRAPVMSSAASCDGANTFVKSGVKGVGAIGLSEQAAVFVAGSTGTSLIIPLSKIVEATPATTFEEEGRTVRRPRPMLVVSWQVADGAIARAAFSVDDALSWAAAMAPMATGQSLPDDQSAPVDQPNSVDQSSPVDQPDSGDAPK